MNDKNKKPEEQRSDQLPAQTIELFLEVQKQDLLNEAERIKLQSKELDFNAQYAHQALGIQGNLLVAKPGEERKTITRWAYIIGGFVLVFLLFIGFCLYVGKEDFALKVLNILGYVVTSAASYWFGQRQNKGNKPNKDDTPSAEIIN